MKKLLFLMPLGLIFNFTLLQAQDIINPVSATTTLTAQFGTTLDHSIDGTGLDVFPSLTANHEMSVFGNSFVAINEIGSIDFDLGGSYLVDGLAFWNQNFFGPIPGENGIQEVLISSSNDGVTYTPIAGAPNTFAQTTCMNCPSEQFSFTEVMASFIRFDVINNWGEPTYVGFSEVAFSGIEATVIENVINPVSATTTLDAQFGSSLDNAINGTGLDAFPSLSATHAATDPSNTFYATNDAGSIDFDLGGLFLVDGLAFWNTNAPGPGGTGIQDVVVSSSEDGVTYTPIAGSPAVFTQVMTQTTPAEMFMFTEVTASYIRFDVLSNYDGSNLVGFAEVAFSGVASLGVNDNVLEQTVKVYPNPARDFVTISNSADVTINSIEIYDMNGRLVNQIKVDSTADQTVNVSELTTGMYFINITSDQATIVKRLIKK
ncbi:MAG: hypothetical protein ACI83B_000600 [Sediminicola sp.]|jgi:hypothetical protein